MNNKIILITHDLTRTGAPILCQKISETLKKNGYYPIIISLRKGTVSQKFIDSACEIHIADAAGSYFQRILRKLFRPDEEVRNKKLEKILKRLANKGINKAIVNTVVSGSSTPILNHLGIKSVCLIHEMRASCQILKAENKINQISQYADFVVFPSECVKSDFLEISSGMKGKMVTMPQGYYKGVFGIEKDSSYRKKLIAKLDIPKDSKIFIGAGSMNFGKGTDLLPLIAKKLEKHKNFHYIWLGAPNDEMYGIWLKNQIRKMELEDRIHFIGYIDGDKEYLEIMCGCEAFLLLSREDSMPSVLFEAMAAKIPILAFKCSGGAQDILAEDRGFLLEYMDLDAYSKVLSGLEINKEFVDQMTEKAYNYLREHMDFKNYVQDIMKLLS